MRLDLGGTHNVIWRIWFYCRVIIIIDYFADGEGSLNLRIKTLEEKIPSSYDQLRQRIEQLARDSRTQLTPPIIRKELFW